MPAASSSRSSARIGRIRISSPVRSRSTHIGRSHRLDLRLGPLEDLQRPVEVIALVACHHRGPQQRAAALDRRVDRHVDVDARVVERLPEQHGLPVVADQHRHDRADQLAAVRQVVGLHHAVAELRQPAVEVAGVVEHLGAHLGALVGADDPQRAEGGAHRRRHRGGREHERARLDAQEVDHVVRAGDEAAAGGERLRERAHAQVDVVLAVEQLRRAPAELAQHADPVGLVDHQAGAVRAAERGHVGQRREVALHREEAVDDHQHPPAVRLGAREHRLELVQPVVAEGPHPRAGERDGVEDRRVVAAVAHDSVAGVEQRADRAGVGEVARGVDDRVLRAHPLGQLALELEVQRGGAVHEARAGQARAVVLERLARGGLDARVAGQPEVVVRAERDPLLALHQGDRAGLGLDHPEVRHQVVLAGGAQLLQALVAAGLFEEVDGGGHVGWRAVSVEVRPVRSLADRRQFIDLPFRLHGTGTPWIPPLRIERHLFLSPRFNAFFKHGEAQLFLAERDGRVVGRVSAQVDRNFNDHHQNDWGMFGFLEFEEDPAVLEALLSAAEGWLRERGRDRMVGPMDFTPNDELGVLIEGFDIEPLVRQPWQPPYYHVLCEQAGLVKEVDLFMWEMKIGNREKILPIIWNLADDLEPKHGIRIRRMTRRGLRRDLDAFAELYNEAWARNWGFVPYGKEDLDAYAQELHLVFDRDWFMVAETAEGETVGIAITVPDINQVLARMKGRLLPLGWLHYLRRKRIVDRCRIGFLGVKPAYQHTGVAAGLYIAHFRQSERSRIKWGEGGWVLEHNKGLNRGMEALGGRIDKKYRVYSREL